MLFFLLQIIYEIKEKSQLLFIEAEGKRNIQKRKKNEELFLTKRKIEEDKRQLKVLLPFVISLLRLKIYFTFHLTNIRPIIS